MSDSSTPPVPVGPNLAAALVKFQAKVKPIKANALNDFLKHNYADLLAIIHDVQPLLEEFKLAVVQLPSNIDGKSALRTIVMHESGESIEDVMPITLPQAREAEKWDPKASKMVKVFIEPTAQDQGANITYLRRYAYMAALGLVADDNQTRMSGNDGRAPMGLKAPNNRASTTKPPTDKQKEMILKLAREREYPDEVVQARLADIKTSAEASTAIDTLMSAPKYGEQA